FSFIHLTFFTVVPQCLSRASWVGHVSTSPGSFVLDQGCVLAQCCCCRCDDPCRGRGAADVSVRVTARCIWKGRFSLRDFLTLARRCILAPAYRGEACMTKADLVDQVAAAAQVPKPQVEAVLTQSLQAIMDALHAGEAVELRGFGSFRLRHRPARAGRNPRTGDSL